MKSNDGKTFLQIRRGKRVVVVGVLTGCLLRINHVDRGASQSGALLIGANLVVGQGAGEAGAGDRNLAAVVLLQALARALNDIALQMHLRV